MSNLVKMSIYIQTEVLEDVPSFLHGGDLEKGQSSSSSSPPIHVQKEVNVHAKVPSTNASPILSFSSQGLKIFKEEETFEPLSYSSPKSSDVNQTFDIKADQENRDLSHDGNVLDDHSNRSSRFLTSPQAPTSPSLSSPQNSIPLEPSLPPEFKKPPPFVSQESKCQESLPVPPPPPPLPPFMCGPSLPPPPPPLPPFMCGPTPPPPPHLPPFMGGPLLPPPPPPLPPLMGGPPPPPPVGGLFPPPPPPPPLMGGPPPPPPLMGGQPPPPQFVSGTFNGPAISTAKYRKLQWQKIPDYIVGQPDSVWSSVASSMTSLKINIDDVNKLFSLKPVTPTGSLSRAGSVRKNNSKPGNADSMEEIYNYIDRRKCMNVSIVLRQFPMSVDDVIRFTVYGETGADVDTTTCTVDQVVTLMKSLPETEELERLKAFKGPVDKLGPAEQFCVKLSRINGYQHKLEFKTLKDEYEQSLVNVKMYLEAIIRCGSAVLGSNVLREVLAIILLIGNHLNAGSHIGRAIGFKMSLLSTLSGMKSPQDDKTTFIHFVIKELDRNAIHVDTLNEDLKYLNEASLYTVAELTSEFEGLKKKVERLKQLIKLFVGDDDDFQRRVSSFVKLAEKETDDVASDVTTANKLNDNLAKYFCEDKTNFKMDECFKNLKGFCEVCFRAKQENEDRRRLAEEAERRLKERMNANKECLSLEKRRNAHDPNINISNISKNQQIDDTDSSICSFDSSKSFRRSTRRGWMRNNNSRQIDVNQSEADEKTITQHENLIDFLEGSHELPIKRTKSFRNSSLNSSYDADKTNNNNRFAIENINNDTRERLPVCKSPLPNHKKMLSSAMASHVSKHDVINAQAANDRMLIDLSKQIDEYIKSNQDIKDEGFESDRFSGSQRSSVCSGDNETPSFQLPEVLPNMLASLAIDTKQIDDNQNSSLTSSESNEVIENSSSQEIKFEQIQDVEKPSHPTINDDSIALSTSTSSPKIKIINDNSSINKDDNDNNNNLIRTSSKTKTPSKPTRTPISARSSLVKRTPPTATRTTTTPNRSITQTSRQLFKDNSEGPRTPNRRLSFTNPLSKSPIKKSPHQTPPTNKSLNDSQRSRTSSVNSSITRPTSITPNKRLPQSSIQDKVRDTEDDKPGLLIRGSAKRKTINPSVLNKNKKIAHTNTKSGTNSYKQEKKSPWFDMFPQRSSILVGSGRPVKPTNGNKPNPNGTSFRLSKNV